MAVSLHEVRPNIQRLAQKDSPSPDPFEWIVMSPENGTQLDYPEEISGFVLRAIYEIDKKLEAHADAPDIQNRLVERVANMEYTQEAQNTVLERIRGWMHAKDSSRVIGLMNGVTPALYSLWSDSELRARIEPGKIVGYHGTEAIDAALKAPLSPENRFAELIFVLDDVWDTGHELAAVLCAIENAKGIESDPSIIRRLKDTFGLPYGNFSELYAQIIPRLHAAGVVVAELFYKNAAFRGQLEQYLVAHEGDGDPWVEAQWSVLEPSLDCDQFDWLTGDGLDTDIPGSKLVVLLRELLPPSLQDNWQVGELLQYLFYSKLRIGSFVDGLIALRRTSKSDLISFVADHMRDEITAWAQNEFRWQFLHSPNDEVQSLEWVRHLARQV